MVYLSSKYYSCKIISIRKRKQVIMNNYENFTKDQLISRIKELEEDAKYNSECACSNEDDTLSPKQREINFLNILMDTILSNVFIAIAVKEIFNGFTYVYFNKAAEDFTGIKAVNIIGKTDFELYSNFHRAHEIRTEDYSTIKNGRTDRWMVDYETPSGEVRIVNMIRLLIKNPDPGASPLLLVMIWDITEQRQIELELIKAQEADKMKNAFIANMSHEIRTPLNAIVGFSNLITETNSTSEQREYAAIINENSDLLLQLINDVLDFSQIESGALNLYIDNVELKDICQVAYTKEALKMTSDVALLFNPETLPDVRINTDARRIEQVIMNILSNAAKFTSAGHILLSYTIDDEFVRISITDTGIGIDKDAQLAIFDRFVKLNDFKQGTGMGLTISKIIIEKLGGEIGVNSEPEKGSTFWFTLPLNNDNNKE